MTSAFIHSKESSSQPRKDSNGFHPGVSIHVSLTLTGSKYADGDDVGDGTVERLGDDVFIDVFIDAFIGELFPSSASVMDI
jgi:hypothetical protein